ncbi:hypothetical protein GKC56_08365 [Neisseriaceae bacterium PsAf]|nr:hypothetical protein [Neisseriaceae bacterium PsAf]
MIFPEGQRNTQHDVDLLPLKSGIYYLVKAHPSTEFVPVWIHNVEKVLPKGKFLPVPVLCQVSLGTPMFLLPSDTKEDFMQRAESNLLDLFEGKNKHE